MKFKRLSIVVVGLLALSGPLAVLAQATGTMEIVPVEATLYTTTSTIDGATTTKVDVPQLSQEELLLTAKVAQQAAAAAELSDREKILLGALALSAVVMVLALMAMLRTRRTFKRHLNEHRGELRKAFADAYVGLKDGALDAKRVRAAEQAIERIISDLEHYLD